MNRRDMMKITALAGVTGATCLSMTESKEKREKPDHLEYGQIWVNNEGTRALVGSSAGIPDAVYVKYWPLRPTCSACDWGWIKIPNGETEFIESWHYCRNIFDQEVGQ